MFTLSTSVLHRYEIFDICKELSTTGHLKKLYSTYPKFEILKYQIPNEKFENFLIYELLSRFNDFLWSKNFYFSKYDFEICDLFDRKISKIIDKNIDVFYGNGGMCLNTFNSLSSNTLKVFHSASMHIHSKKKLLINIGYDENKIVNPLMEEKYIKEIDSADYVVCTSDHTYDSYIENGISENKLILNHSGIDVHRFKYDEKFEIFDDKFRFLFVGNFSLRKGAIKLLEAYKKIRNKNTELIIAGTIDFTIKEKFHNYLKEKDIIYIGKVDNRKLYQLYSKCHLLCLPAIEEGFAKVLGEAMASGLPILCSKNSGGSHFIENRSHGAVLDNLNIDYIADHLIKFSKNLQYIIKNKKNLSLYAKHKFSWEKSVSKLIKVLSSKI